MKRILILLFVFLLAACGNEGLPLENLKEGDVEVDYESEGIHSDIYKKGKELQSIVEPMFNTEPSQSELETYRDAYENINNYFVDHERNEHTIDDYMVLAVASDMWTAADAYAKASDDEEREEYIIKIENSITKLSEHLLETERLE